MTELSALTVRVEAAVEHFEKVLDLNEKLAAANLAIVAAEVRSNAELSKVQFEGQKAAVASALAASEKASLRLETSQNERLTELQGFRDAMSDQAAKFITRREAMADLAAAVGVITAIVAVILGVAGVGG